MRSGPSFDSLLTMKSIDEWNTLGAVWETYFPRCFTFFLVEYFSEKFRWNLFCQSIRVVFGRLRGNFWVTKFRRNFTDSGTWWSFLFIILWVNRSIVWLTIDSSGRHRFYCERHTTDVRYMQQTTPFQGETRRPFATVSYFLPEDDSCWLFVDSTHASNVRT